MELISTYSDVLACTLEKDSRGTSLGTAVVRSVLKVFSLMIFNIYYLKMQENCGEKSEYFQPMTF